MARGFFATAAISTLITLSANAFTSVNLAWLPSLSDGVVGYRVAYAPANDPARQIVDVGNVTTASISGLNDAVTYCFTVTAYDDLGRESAPSNQVTINQGRIANLSTRVGVGNFSHVLISGFIISGTAEKTIVLRAIGPSLSQFGVAGAMTDPVLTIFDSTGTVIASNDNWRDSQEASFAEGGPFHAVQPTNDTEAAIAMTLPPGSYTAIVSGKNNASGVALAELYDYSPNVASSLGNISARALIQTGDDVVIGGITIDGFGTSTRSARLLLRAIGPSLATYGVTGTLADPTLSLYDGNGTLLAFNDDWDQDPDQVAEIESTRLAPDDPSESAIAILLPPGTYTAIVRGNNYTRGIALFDAYQLP